MSNMKFPAGTVAGQNDFIAQDPSSLRFFAIVIINGAGANGKFAGGVEKLLS